MVECEEQGERRYPISEIIVSLRIFLAIVPVSGAGSRGLREEFVTEVSPELRGNVGQFSYRVRSRRMAFAGESIFRNPEPREGNLASFWSLALWSSDSAVEFVD